MLPEVVNCCKCQIVKLDRSSSLQFEIYDLKKHSFEKMPFLDTHLFCLTKRIFDETFFGGSDDPPYCTYAVLETIFKYFCIKYYDF